MKKISTFWLAMIVAFPLLCSCEEEQEESLYESLLGEWMAEEPLSGISESYYDGNVFWGTLDPYKGGYVQYRFNEDGTCVIGLEKEGSSEILRYPSTSHIPDMPLFFVGRWTLDDSGIISLTDVHGEHAFSSIQDLTGKILCHKEGKDLYLDGKKMMRPEQSKAYWHPRVRFEVQPDKVDDYTVAPGTKIDCTLTSLFAGHYCKAEECKLGIGNGYSSLMVVDLTEQFNRDGCFSYQFVVPDSEKAVVFSCSITYIMTDSDGKIQRTYICDYGSLSFSYAVSGSAGE